VSRSATDILDKFRRAYRNKTGAHFTNEELQQLAKAGVLHILAKAEADEIVAQIEPVEQLEKITPGVFSVRTLADHWQCSTGLIRNMIARGELRSFRHGNLIRITADAVAEVEDKRPAP
jgi:excisionase family DNA binding protein